MPFATQVLAWRRAGLSPPAERVLLRVQTQKREHDTLEVRVNRVCACVLV